MVCSFTIATANCWKLPSAWIQRAMLQLACVKIWDDIACDAWQLYELTTALVFNRCRLPEEAWRASMPGQLLTAQAKSFLALGKASGPSKHVRSAGVCQASACTVTRSPSKRNPACKA